MKRAASHQEHIDRLNTAVKAEYVTVTYNNYPVLFNINLDIKAGEAIAIVGPKNSGKTTLLKTILGLIKPDAGTVYIFSRPTMTLKNDIAWVPEKSSIDWTFPTTVFDVALMGSYNRLKSKESPKKTDREMAEDALEKMGLINFRKKSIAKISDSQKQRLLIARALVQDPRIYVMDDPFFMADNEASQIIFDITNSLKKNGKTIIASHHDIFSVPIYFDTVALLNVSIISCGTFAEILMQKHNNSDLINIAASELINDK